MSDEYSESVSSDTDNSLVSMSESEEESGDDVRQQLEDDAMAWLQYCRIAERVLRGYLSPNRGPQYLFPTTRSGHIFMLQNMHVYPQTCFQEFRMYPPLFRHFTHTLRDQYGLSCSANVDVYEQVGMFLCILAHGTGYRKIQTLFGHSLQAISHYFRRVLQVVVALAADIIKPHPDYNEGANHHHPDPIKYPVFQECIGAIDGTHIRAVLPRRERADFIGRKGFPTQNVLAACDFNLCFTFVMPGTPGTTHDSRIMARCIHSHEVHFPEPRHGKYYLVDSGFAHQPGYMAPYKGSDIRYHFQEFRNDNADRRRYRNARERFNFHHSSCRNVIERTFGVWKQRWKILDRMPSYSFRAQTFIVVATMAVHNFMRRNRRNDEGFRRAEEEDDDEIEVDLPDEAAEIAAEDDAIGDENLPWQQLRDYMAAALR